MYVFELILFPNRPDERRLPLSDGVCTIGRAEECTLSVASASVSRQHARIDLQGERAWVTDLGSKNGTFLNELRVERRSPIHAGDMLRVGEVALRLVSGMQPAEAPGPGLVPTAVKRAPSNLAPMPLEVPAQADSLPTLKGLRLPSPVAVRGAEEKLRLLLRVGQLLATPASAETIATRILGLAFQLLEADRGAVLLIDRRTHSLVPAAERNDLPTHPDEKPYSSHVIEWVRNQRAAGLFSNTLIDLRLLGAESVRAAAISSALAAPLVFDDELLGVIYIDSKAAPDRYGEGDLDFLSAFAHLASSALENVRLRERLESEAVARNNLLRFFPPATVRKLEIGAHSLRDAFTTADTEITALFADISGFTEMSTRIAPRALLELLNAYFPVMAEVVFRHDGTLEKYIGDALLAVWGAPIRQTEDADRAVAAAIDMQRALRGLNSQLPWPLSIHIGLHTGPVAAGNIGSADYVQFATIGEATNLASRVCSVAEAGHIVLSETTLSCLTQVPPLQPLGPTALKGREAPLTLYRVDPAIWSVE